MRFKFTDVRSGVVSIKHQRNESTKPKREEKGLPVGLVIGVVSVSDARLSNVESLVHFFALSATETSTPIIFL